MVISFIFKILIIIECNQVKEIYHREMEIIKEKRGQEIKPSYLFLSYIIV